MTRREAVGLGAYVTFVGVAVLVGAVWVSSDEVGLRAAPFYGRWGRHDGLALVPAVLMAAAVVVGGPWAARRVPWWELVGLTALGAAAWSAALAVSEGWGRLTAPLVGRHEYEPYAARLGDAGAFLRTFDPRDTSLPIHVRGHPPGATLVPWALDHVGLSGAGWLAALVILGWGVAAASALVAGRRLLAEEPLRAVAPVLVLLPAAVWAATSMDGLFAGVIGLGICLALSARPCVAVLGGFVLGLALLLSYGAAVLFLIPVGVHLRARHWSLAVAGPAAALAVLVGVGTVTGFWWWDGLAATRSAYWSGIASMRPALYTTLLGNPAVLLIAVGPLVAVGLARALAHPHRTEVLVPILALVAVVAADVSLMSKGEVERIWLPFVPWLALAARRSTRGWLAVQASLGLGVQWWLTSPW